MKIVVDGNDGTGKTTVARALEARGYEVHDRGIPTKMTDDPTTRPVPGEFYLILDVPVEVSRRRLAAGGKDLDERYHTVLDLTHYRRRFQEVAAQLDFSALIDSSGPPEATLARCLEALARAGLRTSTPEV